MTDDPTLDTPLPANENRWSVDMKTRRAIVRHRRPLEVHPVEIVISIAELKSILSEILHTEAMQSPRTRTGQLTSGTEAKRRMAIVVRHEAKAELETARQQPPRSLVE